MIWESGIALNPGLRWGVFISYWQSKVFLVLGKGIYTQHPLTSLDYLPS